MKPKAILFDLDGTLLDTAADLGIAINNLLLQESVPPLSFEVIRANASLGSKVWIKLGLNVDEDHKSFKKLRTRLLQFYSQNIATETRLFPGMETVLQTLETRNIPWGIVTNKPKKYTKKLLRALKLKYNPNCVVSGDTLKKAKPHPEPVLHACKLLDKNPSECYFIGDSNIDITAGKAAGVFAIAALYGYIPTNEDPQAWLANAYIQSPIEILDLL